ncbi:MAG: N-acetylmuramoyl-L-alanine amidase, partial [Leptospiraceae bacterium]|nr:N-acetylmuramoyl-L-alanine amidase [Leptospiraceae bacterium]
GGNISKKYFEKTCIKKTCKSLTKPGAIPTSYKHVTYYAKRFSTPKKKTFIVAIDPGHGGKDPGALGSAGGMEKDIVLAIGRKVAYLVSKHPGMKAVLVRKDDTFIELKERVIKANSMGAKIFVSIHADSTKNKDVFGSSAHVLSNKSKYGDIWKFLAIRNVDYNNLESGLHDSNFLTAYSNSNFDLTEKASQTLASLILKNMEKVNKLLRPEAYKSDFTVLKSWKMPSVLVETDFISNPEREKELLSEHFQNKIARSIFEGIKEYYLFYSVKYL